MVIDLTPSIARLSHDKNYFFQILLGPDSRDLSINIERDKLKGKITKPARVVRDGILVKISCCATRVPLLPLDIYRTNYIER